MTQKSGPIYEVTFFVDADITDECDSWLDDYVRNSLQTPGTIDCTSSAIADDPAGRARRVCLHQFASDEALDEFMHSGVEQEIATRFGDQVEVRNRVLREDSSFDAVIAESPDCLNCGTHLTGQYCGNCGQRSRSRLISLWELISDAFGDLLELDSRLWQTLIPLLSRPGRLTHDYLQGRRARYMPPFRMYLVLSLLFFVVAFFDPREELGLLFEPEAEQASEPVAEEPSEADDVRREVLEELVAEGVLPEDAVSDDGDGGLRVTFDGGDGEDFELDEDCNVTSSDLEGMPGWLTRRLTTERLQRICERTQIDGGQAFIDKLVDNIPAALIILLPLMAFVLKALYPLSKRYYVEHLLFFVHFHAFFFLILSLQILFSRLTTLLSVPETPTVLTLVAASFYIPVYLFISMRRVYGQGRFITFLKYIVLVLAYFFGFSATMMGALAIAAFSI
jgi:hypothetical protein